MCLSCVLKGTALDLEMSVDLQKIVECFVPIYFIVRLCASRLANATISKQTKCSRNLQLDLEPKTLLINFVWQGQTNVPSAASTSEAP